MIEIMPGELLDDLPGKFRKEGQIVLGINDQRFLRRECARCSPTPHNPRGEFLPAYEYRDTACSAATPQCPADSEHGISRYKQSRQNSSAAAEPVPDARAPGTSGRLPSYSRETACAPEK